MQAGRIRYDFVDRLSRSRAKFSSDASGKLDATIQAIETAIEKGMQIRTQSEEVAEEAEAALAKRLEELNRIKDELMMIRHTVESTDA